MLDFNQSQSTAVVRTGAGSRDFFGTAYGQIGGKYDGFQFGEGTVSFDDTLLLIEPDAAWQYDVEQKKRIVVPPPEGEKADPAATATVAVTTAADPGKKPTGRRPGGRPEGEDVPRRRRGQRGARQVEAEHHR